MCMHLAQLALHDLLSECHQALCVVDLLVRQALKDSMQQQGQQGQSGKQIEIKLEEMQGQQAGKAGE